MSYVAANTRPFINSSAKDQQKATLLRDIIVHDESLNDERIQTLTETLRNKPELLKVLREERKQTGRYFPSYTDKQLQRLNSFFDKIDALLGITPLL